MTKQIKLLNDGCYAGLSQVEFPVIVEAEEVSDIEKDLYTYQYRVSVEEIARVGGLLRLMRGLDYLVFVESEVEEIDDE